MKRGRLEGSLLLVDLQKSSNVWEWIWGRTREHAAAAARCSHLLHACQLHSLWGSCCGQLGKGKWEQPWHSCDCYKLNFRDCVSMILVLTDIGRGDRGAQWYGFAVNIACNLVTCGLSLQSPWEMMQENPVGQGGGGKTEPTLCHFHGIGSMLECRPGKTSFYRPCCYRRTCRSPAQADYDC